MTPLYRYQFCDLRTDAHLAWLPLVGVSFDRRIVKAGAFSATLPVPDRAMADRVAHVIPRREDDLSRGPGRTVVHVWRGDQIWGTYVVWRGDVEADRRGRITVSLTGSSLESWFHRYLVLTRNFQQVDQLDIARELVTRTQTGVGNIGLTVGGPATSGILRDRSYVTADRATLGERLEQLSEVINGPEWFVRTFEASGERVREFHVAQNLGNPDRVHHFSQPGTIVAWRHRNDATDAATYHVTRGGDAEGTQTRWVSTRNSNPHYTAGWPRLDAVHDHPSVVEASTVSEYADWWMTYRSGANHTLEVTARMPEEPTLTPDRLGEWARLVIVNDWWPLDAQGAPTFDEHRRVIGMEVRPAARGQAEEATLLFEGPRELGDTTARGVPAYPANIGEMLARQSADRREILSTSVPVSRS